MKLKRKKTGVLILSIFAVILAAVVATLAVLHIFDVFGNRGTFLKGTTISRVDVSELTVREAEERVQQAIDHYQLTVTFAEGTEHYTAEELGLGMDGISALKELMREQHKAVADASDSGSASGQELELTAKDLLRCENETWKEGVAQLPELSACADRSSQDARLVYDAEKAEFTIEREIVGGVIESAELIAAIESQACQLKTELNAVTSGLYDGKSVRTADSAEMQSALAQAENKLNLSLTYTYDVTRADIHGEERIDKNLLSQWLYVEKDGVTVSVNGDRLQEYVTRMHNAYSVKEAGLSQFVTSIGTYVAVNAPAADETVDTDALYNDIERCIERLYSGKREAPYDSTSAGVAGTTHLGGTYVEIDLDHQHLYLYVDKKLITEGDICSGCVADGNATPEGLYTIKSKDHDRYLRGEGYCDWVSYFMPFNGGVGLHDATWRGEGDYGGEVYLEEGSHGCINMPLELAKTIDENVEVGTYVILYGGQPNPAQNSQAIYGTSHYTKTLGSDSFSLDAYTTGDGALSYASSDTSVVTVDQEGGVTVVGAGTATITVTASYTANYTRGTKEITVVVNDTGTE